MLAPQVNIAQRAARQAGQFIRRAMDDVQHLAVQKKGLNDFVTEVDRLSEKVLVDAIRKAYPTHGFLCEEAGLIEGSGEGKDWQWVIDPLDGTTNFIHGFPQFCISIAVKYRGKLEHAFIYDPMRDEEFSATRGRGANLNGRRIRVTQPRGLEGTLIGTGFPFRQDQADYIDHYLAMFKDIAASTAGLRRPGSAALDLAWLAAGRLDGFFEFGLSEWDMAAGALLITEAGGLVGSMNGTPGVSEKGDIVAGSPKVFKGLLQKIQPHLPQKFR